MEKGLALALLVEPAVMWGLQTLFVETRDAVTLRFATSTTRVAPARTVGHAGAGASLEAPWYTFCSTTVRSLAALKTELGQNITF